MLLANKLSVSDMPHLRAKPGISSVMRDVVIALLPAVVFAAINFGAAGITIMAVSVASCVGFEWMAQSLMKKKPTISDFSAVITGILLAFSLPATMPIWMVIAGAFFAIVVVKQLFGGLGQNFLNPALAARAFLLAAYPDAMTDFTFGLAPDTITAATPLASMAQSGVHPSLLTIWSLLWGFGNTLGSIGEGANLLIIIGGVYLLVRKVIRWYIPVTFIGSAALVLFIFGGDSLFAGQPHYDIFAGAIMMGAFFMATRSEEHTSELQSPCNLVCRLLLRSEERRVGKECRSRWSPYH